MNRDSDDDIACDETLAGSAMANDETLVGPVEGSRDARGLLMRSRERYERAREIARGGMGRIVEVRDRELDRRLAIKELLSPSPAMVRRFEREIRITTRLQHPSIIGVIEAGSWEDGEPFYIMTCVEGRALDQVIAQRTSLTERVALLPTIIDVADALAYAHSQRIVHRDLKPANVLVGGFGETVVIDWGLAKDLADDQPDEVDSQPTDDVELTVVGQALGTPAYMPPEQAHGETVDERADVYALGAMLYHLLAGAMPYHDKAPRSADELLSQVKTTPPTPLSALEPKAPADLLTIVAKAMARDPAERYATAGEMTEDLRRFEAGQLVSARDYSTLALVKRWLTRHRAAVAVAAVMVVALAVGGALSFARIGWERDRATRQRKAAEASRAEAEELLGFMLIELQEKLGPIGKLALLDMVARKAATYYARRPIDWSRPDQALKRALAHDNLSDVMRARGDLRGALAEARAALAIRDGLLARNPGNPRWRFSLAVGHHRLGEIRLARGELHEALRQYRAGLAIREELASQDASNSRWQRALAESQERKGGSEPGGKVSAEG